LKNEQFLVGQTNILMKKTVLSLGIILFFIPSFGQVNLQLYGSYIRSLNPDYSNTTQGIGVRFEFGRQDASLTKYVGFAYCFPMHPTDELEAQAYSNWTSPSSVPVSARYNQPMLRLETGGRLYISGDAENFEGFNWWLNGGIEVVYVKNQPTYSEYDKENYTLGFSDESDVNPDGSDKFGLNLHLCVGTGIEKNLGIGNIFLQAAISFPAVTSSNSSSAPC
jgi:hypothetical protein